MKRLLVTGGAGFIGSALVRHLLSLGHRVIVLDAFTYAGRHENLTEASCPRLKIIEADLRNIAEVRQIVSDHALDGVFHLAAESHVDNSILGPKIFFETNILGTLNLFEACREAMSKSLLGPDFRLLHVSTDEVFGSLGNSGSFHEDSPYQPRSPYSASKAGSDHIAAAWFHTYNFPVVITNCSNNFGPRQYPEKFIPRMITSALTENALPVYGTGQNVRDWIHVEDHCHGLWLAFEKGQLGMSYLFGGRSERNNLQVVHQICTILDRLCPRAGRKKYADLIQMVIDRPGHDFRYSVDCTKAEVELGYANSGLDFETALQNTVQWYIDNPQWVVDVNKRLKAG